MNALAEGDIREIAGVLGVNKSYVLKILKGLRSIKSPLAQEVMRVTFYRAKQNRCFRKLVA